MHWSVAAGLVALACARAPSSVDSFVAPSCAAEDAEVVTRELLEWLAADEHPLGGDLANTQGLEQKSWLGSIRFEPVPGYGMSAVATREIRDQDIIMKVPQRCMVNTGRAKGTIAETVVQK